MIFSHGKTFPYYYNNFDATNMSQIYIDSGLLVQQKSILCHLAYNILLCASVLQYYTFCRLGVVKNVWEK